MDVGRREGRTESGCWVRVRASPRRAQGGQDHGSGRPVEALGCGSVRWGRAGAGDVPGPGIRRELVWMRHPGSSDTDKRRAQD